MSFFMDKVTRIYNQGFWAVFYWILAKALFAFGAGLLLATFLPERSWGWIGMACIVLAILVGLPIIKIACSKDTPSI